MHSHLQRGHVISSRGSGHGWFAACARFQSLRLLPPFLSHSKEGAIKRLEFVFVDSLTVMVVGDRVCAPPPRKNTSFHISRLCLGETLVGGGADGPLIANYSVVASNKISASTGQ